MKKLTLAVCVTAVLLLSACGGGGDESATEDKPKKTALVVQQDKRTAEGAKEELENFIATVYSGDFAEGWEFFSKELRKMWPREVYVAVQEECLKSKVTPVVTSSRLSDEDTAVMELEVGGVKGGLWTLKYEDGEWRKAPDAENRANAGKSAEEIIADRRQEGSC